MVILIIGILAAIAVPVFLNQRIKANDAKLKSDMKSVAIWMETNKVNFPDAIYPRFAASWYNPDPAIPSLVFGVPFDVSLSQGVGIITSDSSVALFGGAGASPGSGFCIEGQALNSSYHIGTTGQRLWYSSIKGGFIDSCTL